VGSSGSCSAAGRAAETLSATPTAPSNWTDPAWRDEILAWASAGLEAAGHHIVGPVEQPHVRPWSTVFRIPTDSGAFWCKAAGLGPRHEAALLDRFAAWGTIHVLRPLAVDAARGWMLLPDGGPRLRDLAPDERGDHDLEAWIRLLPVYADLQRTLEDRADELVTAGVPDERPERLVGVLDGLVGADPVWSRLDADEIEQGAVAREFLRRGRADVAALAADLASSGIRPSIEHGDLHGGNILVGPDGVRFYDWGDATVAHPFGTLTTTLSSIAYHTGLERDGAELARVCDAYTEGWTDVLPRSALAEVAGLATDLAHIGKSSAWARAVEGVDPAAMGEYGGGAGGWLIDFADRLERRLTR
jgi:hypothetical protein